MKALSYIMSIGGLFFLASCSEVTPAPAIQLPEQTKQIQSIHWNDGDHGKIILADGKEIFFQLKEIDAPETGPIGDGLIFPKCEKERKLGIAAKEWVVKYTRDADLEITSNGWIRTYRNIIDISVNGQDLGESGKMGGYFRSWKHTGLLPTGTKPNWCDTR